ncbi:MAG: hypothetical protein QN183_12135 [Armatimonadota bacterium]|nr:hypothetical protein [Armatimonadota bacterium]MDR7532753.1 hypothetical protein [Armatimonadota bacterium]MDR7537099.1 hypothetical protein [Armatimonadota bacterium]
MTRGTWLLLLAFILGMAWPVLAQQGSSPTVLIVPGQSIAGVALGRSVSSVVARLGQPGEARLLRDGTLYTFPRYGLNVYATDGVVRAISTTNSLLRTSEGITLGSTVTDVRRVFGAQFADAVVEGLMGMAFDQHGIAFGLDGVVVSVIIVYPPRTQAAPPSAVPAQSSPQGTAVPAAAPAPAVTAPGAPPAPPASPAATAVPSSPAAATAGPIPAGRPAAAPATPYIDLGLVVMPRVENLRPFSPETQYMSVVGFLRYVVYQQTGTWLTYAEATRMLHQQQRIRL